MENARLASSIAGQGRSVVNQSLDLLQRNVDYWAAQIRRIRAKSAGAQNAGFSVARWT